MSALDWHLIVLNSSVVFQGRVGTKSQLAIVAEIRKGVTFCVFFQVGVD